jgi:hypothetical protein
MADRRRQLHNKQGGKVLEFNLVQPHDEAELKCSACGNIARHVWPSKTKMAALECVCGKVGTLNYNLPDGPCEHGDKYQWARMTTDGAVTGAMFCIGCEFNTIAGLLSQAGLCTHDRLSDDVRALVEASGATS